MTVTEYYPVPEKWFVGARRRAAGIPGTHRVDWLYGGSGLFLEGDGVDLQGRRVHLNSDRAAGLGRQGRQEDDRRRSRPDLLAQLRLAH